MKIALLATGTELLDGRINDANGVLLGRRLAAYGLRLNHLLCCGDSSPEIAEALSLLVKSNDLVIVSGGLGPTEADQTRAAFGLELMYDRTAETRIRELVAKRGRPLSENMLKQCYLPKGAERFDNPVGSADPFVLHRSQVTLIAVPGVPKEFAAITDSLILPQIAKKASELGFVLKQLEQREYRIIGLTESQVAESIQHSSLNNSVEILIRTDFPEVQVILRNRLGSQNFLAETARFEATIPVENVFSTSLAISFAQTVVSLLQDENVTIATAESCTGGLVGTMLTKIPGASAVFKGAIVAYSNEIKIDVLGVSKDLLLGFGAVSRECACAMAEKIRDIMRTDIGVSITGIAGPDGGSPLKPVGTVFIGLSTKTKTKVFTVFFKDERERVQQYAAYAALDELRRILLHLPPRFEAL